MNKPNLLAVFAHPDDEAFGPSATLIKMAKDYDIHILFVTRGQTGANHGKDQMSPLSHIRENEARKSAMILGATSVEFLDFIDGNLCNNLYQNLEKQIADRVQKLNATTMMTWEPKGVTGHIDHMVVSMVCHHIFHKSDSVKKLMLYCLSKYQTMSFLEGYFVYRPPGYDPKDIDLVVDVSDVWEQKLEAIKCHKSQIKDFQKVMNRPKIRLMEDCFQVLIKP